MKKKIAVLNVGTQFITALCGSKTNGNNFAVHCLQEEEYAGFDGGEFLEKDALCGVFENCIKKMQNQQNFKTTKLFVSVPCEFSICKTITVSVAFDKEKTITKKDQQKLLEKAEGCFDNKNYVLICSSVIKFYMADGVETLNLIGKKLSKITAKVSLIFAEKNYIITINEILKKIGILSVEYLSAPLCECLYSIKKNRKAGIIINCDHISTSIAVFYGNGVVNLKSFDVGGGHIAFDLMQCLNIPYFHCQKLKDQAVLSLQSLNNYVISHDGQVFEASVEKTNAIISSRISMIAQVIFDCLKDKDNKLPPLPIYLSGGGISLIRGAKAILQEILGVEIEIACPKEIKINSPCYNGVAALLNAACENE